MKLFRRTFAFLMALMLMMSMSLTVLAYDAGSLADGFGYDGEDTEVNITASEGEGGDYEAKEGKTYNISGGTLSDVSFTNTEESSSAININTDVNGTLKADGNVDVTVNGDVTSESTGVEAAGGSNVIVNGDVTSTGDYCGGVEANEESTVIVNGDVSGAYVGVYADGGSYVAVNGDEDSNGDVNGGYRAGVQAFGGIVEVAGDVNAGEALEGQQYGATGVESLDGGIVVVYGDVTGGEANVKDGVENVGGQAIYTNSKSTVAVAGDVTGGNGVGSAGVAASGVHIDVLPAEDEEVGQVLILGAVSAGEGADSYADIYMSATGEEDSVVPSIAVGSYESIEGEGITDEELEEISNAIEIIVFPDPDEGAEDEAEPEPVKPEGMESHWGYLLQAISVAKPGDKLTTDAGARKYIPAVVIEYVRKYDVELTVKWTGGDDLVITKDFTGEVSGYVLLTDLAAMLKK